MLIRRDGNISHLFISLATHRSMGESENMSDHIRHGINLSMSCSTTFTLGFDITSVIGQ